MKSSGFNLKIIISHSASDTIMYSTKVAPHKPHSSSRGMSKARHNQILSKFFFYFFLNFFYFIEIQTRVYRVTAECTPHSICTFSLKNSHLKDISCSPFVTARNLKMVMLLALTRRRRCVKNNLNQIVQTFLRYSQFNTPQIPIKSA